MQHVQEDLRASEGKGRDQHGASALNRFRHHLQQRRLEVRDRLMPPFAVGALHDQKVKGALLLGKGEGGVVEDRLVEAAQIAGETQANGAPVALEGDDADGRSQNVPGVVERAADPVADRDRVPIRGAVEIGERLLGIGQRVERPDLLDVQFIRQAPDRFDIELMAAFFQESFGRLQPSGPFVGSLSERTVVGERRADVLIVEVVCIGLLNAGRIRQQVAAGRSGRARADDTAVEPVGGQDRDPAGVVDVGVGQDQIGDQCGVEGQDPVFFRGFPPPALEKPAVEQDAVVAGGDQVHGPGDLPRGAVKCDLHDECLCS